MPRLPSLRRLDGYLRALRRRAVLLAAGVVVRARPLAGYRRRLLSTWAFPEQRGRVGSFLHEDVLAGWLEREYWPEPDPAQRDELKAVVIGGAAGRRWAEEYDRTPLDTTRPLFSEIAEALARIDGPRCLIQIGCSSGREIAWFARRFPDVRCVGTDVFEEVAEFAASAHSEANLEFQRLAAEEAGALAAKLSETIVVFSSGALQYVQPEHLCGVLRSLAAVPRLHVIASETVYAPGEDAAALTRSLPRAGFAWTHPYRRLGEACGFETVRCELSYPFGHDEREWRAATGDLLWHGRVV